MVKTPWEFFLVKADYLSDGYSFVLKAFFSSSDPSIQTILSGEHKTAISETQFLRTVCLVGGSVFFGNNIAIYAYPILINS